MKTVYAKHDPYTNGHIGKVLAEMEVTGAPTIRVVKRGDAYYALEGSHRLYCAKVLGLEPKLVVEIQETGEELASFWDRVAPDLPRYDFNHVRVLDLMAFHLKDGPFTFVHGAAVPDGEIYFMDRDLCGGKIIDVGTK